MYASQVKRIKNKGKCTPQAKKISSPKLLQQFSPVGRVIRRNSFYGGQPADQNPKEDNKTIGKNESLNADLAKKEEEAYNSDSSYPKNHTIQRQHSSSTIIKKEVVSKKSHFFQEAVQQSPWVIEEVKDHVESIIFCKCGKLCKEAFNLCEECIASGKVHEAGGYLYLKRDQNNLDRFWFQLINKELYCINCDNAIIKIGYKNKEDKEHISMNNINGYVVEEEEEIKIDTKYTIYPFSLCAHWDKRTFYSLKTEERKVWVESIRSVLCYSDIYKAYDLGVKFYQDIFK